MAKKKTFEFVGIGAPTNSAGIPVTYILSGIVTVTVYVFGLHPAEVYDRDECDCKAIQDVQMAAHAVDAVKEIWEWVEGNREFAIQSYLSHKNLTAANPQSMAADEAYARDLGVLRANESVAE